MASLVADYGTSQSESSSEEGESENDNKKSDITFLGHLEKLPPPSFCGSGGAAESSVFVNPYVEAENAEKAVLEKHVKMIPTKDSITSINGKKICWMYRKGRCRFGHNCKYAHDSDLFNSSGLSSMSDEQNGDNLATKEAPEKTESVDQGIDGSSDKKRKKRPGLSQGLVPGKKVIKMFKKQKGQ